MTTRLVTQPGNGGIRCEPCGLTLGASSTAETIKQLDAMLAFAKAHADCKWPPRAPVKPGLCTVAMKRWNGKEEPCPHPATRGDVCGFHDPEAKAARARSLRARRAQGAPP